MLYSSAHAAPAFNMKALELMLGKIVCAIKTQHATAFLSGVPHMHASCTCAPCPACFVCSILACSLLTDKLLDTFRVSTQDPLIFSWDRSRCSHCMRAKAWLTLGVAQEGDADAVGGKIVLPGVGQVELQAINGSLWSAKPDCETQAWASNWS